MVNLEGWAVSSGQGFHHGPDIRMGWQAGGSPSVLTRAPWCL